MSINKCTIIIAICLWSTVTFPHDFEAWENAIRNSDLIFFSRMPNDEKIPHADIAGLLITANDIVEQRKNDIFERKCRVYTGTALKLIPITGFCPIIGFILDQRALGAILGIGAFALIASATLMTTKALAEDKRIVAAAITKLVGAAITIAGVAGCGLLECWFWQREQFSHDKLEKAYQDAVKIKAYLTTLAS